MKCHLNMEGQGKSLLSKKKVTVLKKINTILEKLHDDTEHCIISTDCCQKS